MVALLLVAAPTYLLIGETADAVVALAALVPIAAVGWLLESRAERALDRLRALTAPSVTVWRDGARRRIGIEDLVVGDLVVLRQGDVVPADAQIVELTQLMVDESALTGESLPVAKVAPAAGAGDDAAVWAGTTVLSGRALVRVSVTGETGTLTEGRLALAALWTPEGGRTGAGLRSHPERVLIETAVLACEPAPYDPLDVAVVDHARRHAVDVEALHAGDLVADWPFDPRGKYVTHVWRHPGREGVVVAAKGSIEGLVAGSQVAAAAAARAAHDAFASDGMRVVAVARVTAPGASGDRPHDETGLRLVGLLAFSDPIRPGGGEALAECRTAGIRVIMVTGDHPATAHAVAEGLGLPHEDAGRDVIATGDDLDAAGRRGTEVARGARGGAPSRVAPLGSPRCWPPSRRCCWACAAPTARCGAAAGPGPAPSSR